MGGYIIKKLNNNDLSEIAPNLGIGDILILKLRAISNNIEINKINIRLKLIHENTSNIEVKINFLKLFLKLLFPQAELYFIKDCPLNDLRNYRINLIYLYDYIKLNQINNYNNYIIFHTKVRLDVHCEIFKKYIPIFDNYIKNLKTSKNIILMGERIIEKNFETKTLGVISLYNLLMQLNNNNNLIDLTKEVLCSGNSDFNNFLEDIEIINKADCNITFGIGGPFCISNTFSKNVINFIPNNTNYGNNDFVNLINNNFSDINEFINKINYYI